MQTNYFIRRPRYEFSQNLLHQLVGHESWLNWEKTAQKYSQTFFSGCYVESIFVFVTFLCLLLCYTLLYLQIQDNFLLTTNASVFTHCCACMYVCSFTSDKGNAFRLRIVIYIWRVIKFLISVLIREG